MRELREFDRVELVDGRVGNLIEVFGDGTFLFEWATPKGPDAYDDEFIKLDQIAALLEKD